MVAKLRWINGMALARAGNKGHLSMEKEYAQVQSPTRCSRTKTAAKTRETEKKKKLRKPGCHIHTRGKLAPRYIGPFQIIAKKGKVAYQLELPPELSDVHDVFHISQLRKCIAPQVKQVDV